MQRGKVCRLQRSSSAPHFTTFRYIRESLKRFIEQLGYVPVLSEDGAVYYDPKIKASESCITDIPNAQLFVLIIGGRFGSTMPDSDQSITNAEYQKAIQEKVPVFALVDHGTYNDFQLYRHNVARREALDSIVFPNADSTKVFDFIQEVQTASINNVLYPFRTYNDIESYLKAQWAAMVYSFLTKAAESRKVVDSLAILETISARTELIAEQILRNVGQVIDQLVVDFLQKMLVSHAVEDLRTIRLSPTPADIAKNETLQECVEDLGGRPFRVLEARDGDNEISISSDSRISARRLQSSEEDYAQLRSYILSELKRRNVSLKDFYDYPFSPNDSDYRFLPSAPSTSSSVAPKPRRSVSNKSRQAPLDRSTT